MTYFMDTPYDERCKIIGTVINSNKFTLTRKSKNFDLKWKNLKSKILSLGFLVF